MTGCLEFRKAIAAGTDDAVTRAHLRACADCLALAVERDPDSLFRAIGGEILPPGGVDEFTGEVMHQIRMREAEQRLDSRPRKVSPWIGWSVAATLAVAVLTGSMAYRSRFAPPVVPAPPVPVATVAVMDRPIIENYDSAGAFIIEVPAEETSDIRLVMVFDESLPADL